MSGSFLRAEVASQPDAWRQAGVLARSHSASLPGEGQRVAVVGCGTSLYMSQVYATLREQAGAGWTDAFPASEHRDLALYDAVVAITRSGTTTEVVELLAQLRGRVPTTVLVADLATPAVELADSVVPFDFADERSIVQTRFATSVVAFFRAALGQSLEEPVRQARAVLDGPVTDDIQATVEAEQTAFLGTGWTIGLASEAALKLRESAQAWTEAYPATEYRHGPISIAAPGRVTWAFGGLPSGLGEQVRRAGGTVVASDLDPLADLVRVHRVCIERSQRLGLDPDAPRHLTRSIVLAP